MNQVQTQKNASLSSHIKLLDWIRSKILKEKGVPQFRKWGSADHSSPLFSFFVFLLIFGTIGCAKQGEKASSPVQQSSTPPVVTPPPNEASGVWHLSSAKGSWFEVQSRKLSDDQVLSKQKEFNGAVIREVSDTQVPYRSYLIEGSTIGRKISILPKLLIKSEVFGGRVRFTDAGTKGSSSVRINLALVDGRSKEIHSGFSAFPIPSEYEITSETNPKASDLSSSSDCPDRIELRQGSESLPLSPVFGEDGCPRNEFFEIAASSPSKELRKWFEDRIPQGDVVLWASFKPKASFLKEAVSVDINPFLLYEKLYSAFVEANSRDVTPLLDQVSFSAKQVHDRVAHVLSSSFKDSGFNGLNESELRIVLDTLMSIFFNSSNGSCGVDDGICFKLKARPDSSESQIHFAFNRTESVAIPGEAFELSTPVRDLSQDVELFKINAEQTDDATPPKSGRIGGLLRQVAAGDLVELEISKIIGIHRDPEVAYYRPEKSRLNNSVCVSYGVAPTIEVTDPNTCLEYNQECRQWKDCNAWGDPCVEWEAHCCRAASRGSEHCSFVRSNDPNNFGGWRDCSNKRCVRTTHVCVAPTHECVQWVNTSCKRFGTKRVPNGPAPCEQYENQWVKYYDLGEPTGIHPREENLGAINQSDILSGLQIQFSSIDWKENSHFDFIKITCPLSSFFPEFKQEGDRLKIRFRVQNQELSGCLPFNARNSIPGYYPEISLVNQLVIEDQSLCGFVEEYWNGTRMYNCPMLGKRSNQKIYQTYYPRMEVQGKFKLPGLRFISVNNGG